MGTSVATPFQPAIGGYPQGNDMSPWKMAAIAAAAAATVIGGIQAYASSVALDNQDRLFMEAVIRAGLFELRSGDLALQRSSREDVRAYARAVLDDQAAARAQLLAVAAAKSRAVPSVVGAEQQAVLAELKNAPRGTFDTLYLEKVAVQGQSAVVALFKRTVRNSNDPDIRAYAANVLPMLQRHLEQARTLQVELRWTVIAENAAKATAKPTVN